MATKMQKIEASQQYARILFPEWETNRDVAELYVSVEVGFIGGANWQEEEIVAKAKSLMSQSFEGWHDEAINGYATAIASMIEGYVSSETLIKIIKQNGQTT